MNVNLAIYPCDAGMPGGTYRGLHKFEATAYGICCVLCGAKPKASDGGSA